MLFRLPQNRRLAKLLGQQGVDFLEHAILSRSVIVELAGLDGAVVVDNQGHILAYGAVLEPGRRGRVEAEEGSRTKAAVGASHYGLAIKVGSDGDIAVFVRDERFLTV